MTHDEVAAVLAGERAWAVVQGDAAAVLPTLSDGSVDAVITDPPYGIGYDYHGEREVASDAAAYWAWFAPIYAQMMRCLKPGGFMAIWQTQLYMRHFWDWYGDDIHIYCAAKNFVQLRPTPINHAYDPVVMLYKAGGDPLCSRKPPRNVDFYVADTASLVSNPQRPEKAHPTPKPVALMREIVRNFTYASALVLDPFAGSGSTGKACICEDRRFIGIEIRERYVDLATSRMNATSGPLFTQLEVSA